MGLRDRALYAFADREYAEVEHQRAVRERSAVRHITRVRTFAAHTLGLDVEEVEYMGNAEGVDLVQIDGAGFEVRGVKNPQGGELILVALAACSGCGQDWRSHVIEGLADYGSFIARTIHTHRCEGAA